MIKGIQVTRTDTNEKYIYHLISINSNCGASNLLLLCASGRIQLTGVSHSSAPSVQSNLTRGRPMKHKQFTALSKFTFDKIDENDSIYILQCFLDERYPRGGKIYFAEEECHDTVRRLRNAYDYGYFTREYSDYIQSGGHVTHPWLAQHIYY